MYVFNWISDAVIYLRKKGLSSKSRNTNGHVSVVSIDHSVGKTRKEMEGMFKQKKLFWYFLIFVAVLLYLYLCVYGKKNLTLALKSKKESIK